MWSAKDLPRIFSLMGSLLKPGLEVVIGRLQGFVARLHFPHFLKVVRHFQNAFHVLLVPGPPFQSYIRVDMTVLSTSCDATRHNVFNRNWQLSPHIKHVDGARQELIHAKRFNVLVLIRIADNCSLKTLGHSLSRVVYMQQVPTSYFYQGLQRLALVAASMFLW